MVFNLHLDEKFKMDFYVGCTFEWVNFWKFEYVRNFVYYVILKKCVVSYTLTLERGISDIYNPRSTQLI